MAQNIDSKTELYWDNGFKLENLSQGNSIKIGGRVHYDIGAFELNQEAISNKYLLKSSRGNEFRRSQIDTSGKIFNKVGFTVKVSVNRGGVEMLETYLLMQKLPIIGNLMIGNIVEPFGLETITSSKYGTFMERSLTYNFSPGIENGLMFFNEFHNHRIAYQIGVFGLVDYENVFSENLNLNENFAVTGRLAGTVINSEELLFHLGGAYSYRVVNEENKYGFNAKPEVNMSNIFLQTNLMDVNNVNLFNVESSIVSGPISFQAEYAQTNVYAMIKDHFFRSFYTQLSYFLTGESRKYENSLDGFGRVIPKKRFGKNGFGAVELAVRYSTIEGLENDKMSNLTAGATWIINETTKIMPNYVISHINNNNQFKGEGQFKGFQVRFEVDF